MKEQSIEEKRQMVMELLVEICYNPENIPNNTLYPIALYLYQNATFGPKGIKAVASHLVTLHDFNKSSHSNLYELGQQEKSKLIFEKLYKSLDYKSINMFVKEKALQVLEKAHQISQEGKLVDSVYTNSFYETCHKLSKNCEHKTGNRMMYLQTMTLSSILEKNEQYQQEICMKVMNAKARLEVLISMTKNPENKEKLNQLVTTLEHAWASQNYSIMQEELVYANATFYQATRSSYQKKRD